MKNTQIIIFLFFFLSTLTACGQQHNHNNHNETKEKSSPTNLELGKLESSVKQNLSNLLNIYYEIKDALVAGNGETAQQKAGLFVKTLSLVKMDKMTSQQHSFWLKYYDKIKSDAEHINGTKEVAHQRDHFNNLSNNIWEVTKTFKTNAKPAYQQYCPMKKSYWISQEKAVKNPYYGDEMLTCGKVSATL